MCIGRMIRNAIAWLWILVEIYVLVHSFVHRGGIWWRGRGNQQSVNKTQLPILIVHRNRCVEL